jgi:transcriptional regulator GlxA family with amidase domain
VHTLLRRLARAAGAAGLGPGGPPRLEELRDWLDYHFREPVSLAALARRCGWSVGHLCARFRARYGMPPYEYVLRLRLAQARLLLADPARSAASVARELGWNDLRAFRRLVARRLGVPPGKLRR